MNNVNDLIYELFCQLGLQLRKEDNTVIYQGYQVPVLYNNKSIKFSYEGPLLLNRDEVWLDVFNNLDMVQKLYQLYIKVLFQDEGIRIINYKFDQTNDGKYILETSYIEGIEKIEKTTKAYNIPSLCYMESILDYNVNLSVFDRTN